MNIFLKVSVALLFVISYCANANDSTARVGAGGLELLKTESIQMVSEVLEISTSKIKVTYHFLNISDKDIKTTVAFPMPAFNGGPKDHNRPLDSFQILVDGASVTVQKNRVFLVDNIDTTDKLRKIGLSEEQIFDPMFTCTSFNTNNKCSFTEKQLAQLEKLETSSDWEGWQIKETAYWEQTFPAGKEIEVIHEYTPFLGKFQTGSKQKLSEIISLLSGKEACARETFKSMKSYSNLEKFYYGGIFQVEYILGTGRNWDGPINNFKLILQKDSPEEIVSLCFPGKSIKTSPTTIEFSRINFVPQDKLIVFFYDLHRLDED